MNGCFDGHAFTHSSAKNHKWHKSLILPLPGGDCYGVIAIITAIGATPLIITCLLTVFDLYPLSSPLPTLPWKNKVFLLFTLSSNCPSTIYSRICCVRFFMAASFRSIFIEVNRRIVTAAIITPQPLTSPGASSIAVLLKLFWTISNCPHIALRYFSICHLPFAIRRLLPICYLLFALRRPSPIVFVFYLPRSNLAKVYWHLVI